MSHDEYNSGMRSGYSSALRILREVDRGIEYPRSDNLSYEKDIDWQEQNIIYNTKKDFMHEIYGAIKKDMEEYTDEDF